MALGASAGVYKLPPDLSTTLHAKNMRIDLATTHDPEDLAALKEGMRRYEMYGVLEDRPIGTVLYHMKKRIDGPGG